MGKQSMNYDYMVAEHVNNRIGMVTTLMLFVRWHWRWELRDEDWHANILAWIGTGTDPSKRMDNRLCSPECN